MVHPSNFISGTNRQVGGSPVLFQLDIVNHCRPCHFRHRRTTRSQDDARYRSQPAPHTFPLHNSVTNTPSRCSSRMAN